MPDAVPELTDISRLFYFFSDNFPSVYLICWFFPLMLLYAFAALYLSGRLKIRFDLKTGYSRKIFHFIIFITAGFCQLIFGLSGVFILGWSVTLVLLFACYKGKGNLMYEAIARESDAPFRTRYIAYSYLATFTGGVLSNLFFGYFAIFGYAVTGIADALAEPVGIRFGKHAYRVFSFNHKVAHRTLEGSAAVFISTFIIGLLLMQISVTADISFLHLLLIAAGCSFVEAVSPRGFDNALLQVTASLLFFHFSR
jgi:phytol kinase